MTPIYPALCTRSDTTLALVILMKSIILLWTHVVQVALQIYWLGRPQSCLIVTSGKKLCTIHLRCMMISFLTLCSHKCVISSQHNTIVHLIQVLHTHSEANILVQEIVLTSTIMITMILLVQSATTQGVYQTECTTMSFKLTALTIIV